MDTKICAWCSEAQPLTEYHKDAKSSDGKQSMCRACKTKRKNTPKEMKNDRVETPEHLKKMVYTQTIHRLHELGLWSTEGAKQALERVSK